MSDENPTQTGDLGEQPEPQIEPGEPNPGGADAVPEDEDTIPADLGRRPTLPWRSRPTRSRRCSRRARTPTTEATESDNGSDEDVEPHEDSPA